MIDLSLAPAERVALAFGEREVRYRELARLVAAEEVQPGQRVVIVAEPTLPAIVRLLACLSSGATAVLLHPRWTEPEREAAAARALATAIPLPACPALIVFTSGSTKTPRGVLLSARALAASAAASAENLGWRDGDGWLLALPFAHVGGLSVLTRTLSAHRSVVIATGDLGRALTDPRVTLASLVPTQLSRLCESGMRAPGQLRAVVVGGGAATPALLSRARALGWPALASYGLTETCSQVATQRPGASASDDCGAPLRGIEVRIENGVIHVRGAVLADATIDGPLALRDGWLDTGDLGELDAAGHLIVRGRRSDIIITGGENVSPAEVEAALEQAPGVAAACVFGIPDEHWGELVAAAVVPAAGAPERAALAAALEAIAPFKRPRALAFLPMLPTSANGKVDRNAARSAARPLLESF